MPLPILFIPGMLCDERLFRPQIEALGRSRSIHVADISKDDTIEAMARRALRAAPSKPFVLAGLSMGGIVAMEMLRIAPERIARLVLMATNHRAASMAFRTIRSEQLERARKGHFKDIIIDEFKAQYLSPDHADDPILLQLIIDMALSNGLRVFEAQSHALIERRDQSDTLAKCQCSTLIIAGENDRLCPVATHKDMAGIIPDAQLVVLPRTGHVLTLEKPAEVNALLA